MAADARHPQQRHPASHTPHVAGRCHHASCHESCSCVPRHRGGRVSPGEHAHQPRAPRQGAVVKCCMNAAMTLPSVRVSGHACLPEVTPLEGAWVVAVPCNLETGPDVVAPCLRWTVECGPSTQRTDRRAQLRCRAWAVVQDLHRPWCTWSTTSGPASRLHGAAATLRGPVVPAPMLPVPSSAGRRACVALNSDGGAAAFAV